MRSSNLVWGVPDEQDEDGLGEFKELVQGEITPGSVVEFPTSHFLTVTQAPPAWTVHQAFEYLQAYLHQIRKCGPCEDSEGGCKTTKVSRGKLSSKWDDDMENDDGRTLSSLQRRGL